MPIESVFRYARIVCAIGLIALFISIVIRSFPIRIELDGPIMLYMGFLMDHYHAVPYRDWFDMNLPGSYLIYFLLGKMTHNTDLGLHIVDLMLLLVIMVTTWLSVRRFGTYVACSSCFLFGIMYLSGGAQLSLQREYFIVLLVGLVVALMSLWKHKSLALLGGIVSVLLGLCATIKPQMLLLWPVVIYYLLQSQNQGKERGKWLDRNSVRILTFSIIGLVLPLGIMAAYLWQASALPAFTDIAIHYWPLYGAMDGQHHSLEGTARIKYLIRGFLGFCHLRFWLLPAAAGVFIKISLSRKPGRETDPSPEEIEGSNTEDGLADASTAPTESGQESTFLLSQEQLLPLYIALTIFFAIYPVFSGQFWGYHGLPFVYFTIILGSMCFLDIPPSQQKRLRLVSDLRFWMMAILLLVAGNATLHYRPVNTPDLKRVDEIASYLKSHLKPGDTVQPLDWTGGAVQGMLIAQARIATSFIYDFHFYHNVSKPYIQSLRQRFITELQSAHPRFIVEITTRKPWPSGKDTTRTFPELRQILKDDYNVVKTGDGYIISERKASVPPTR